MITVKIPIAYGLAEALRSKGYNIADTSGQFKSEPDHDYIGILKPRPATKGFLGRMKYERSIFIGILWITNPTRGAEEHDKWIFEVYGKENLVEAQEIAKFLQPHPILPNIEIRLDTDNLRYENYDYYRRKT